ncbi:hypothetical protein Syun_002423 [Stephania yunnanensis]|uniref:Uncharacterized protein n=1 Tax=Stephania yunnanensis TaxID=152371 RepID=A0AAP0LGJ3_9MAGN
MGGGGGHSPPHLSSSTLVGAAWWHPTLLAAAVMLPTVASVIAPTRFVPYSVNSVVLMTLGSVFFGRRPPGVAGGQYLLGFLMTTISAAALLGLLNPSAKVAYTKNAKNITYSGFFWLPMGLIFSGFSPCERRLLSDSPAHEFVGGVFAYEKFNGEKCVGHTWPIAQKRSRLDPPSPIETKFSCAVLGGIGSIMGPILLRLYYIHGGNRKWILGWLQSPGFPILLIPISINYLCHRRNPSSSCEKFFISPKVLLGASVLGLLYGLDNFMYTFGLSYLLVSTSSIIYSIYLVFIAFFSFFVVGQRLTPYSVNDVVLMTLGLVLLAIRQNDDKPSGVSAGEYLLGFLLTIGNQGSLNLVSVVLTAVVSQMSFIGAVEVMFSASALASGVYSATLVPVTLIAGATVYHEKFSVRRVAEWVQLKLLSIKELLLHYSIASMLDCSITPSHQCLTIPLLHYPIFTLTGHDQCSIRGEIWGGRNHLEIHQQLLLFSSFTANNPSSLTPLTANSNLSPPPPNDLRRRTRLVTTVVVVVHCHRRRRPRLAGSIIPLQRTPKTPLSRAAPTRVCRPTSLTLRGLLLRRRCSPIFFAIGGAVCFHRCPHTSAAAGHQHCSAAPCSADSEAPCSADPARLCDPPPPLLWPGFSAAGARPCSSAAAASPRLLFG